MTTIPHTLLKALQGTPSIDMLTAAKVPIVQHLSDAFFIHPSGKMIGSPSIAQPVISGPRLHHSDVERAINQLLGSEYMSPAMIRTQLNITGNVGRGSFAAVRWLPTSAQVDTLQELAEFYSPLFVQASLPHEFGDLARRTPDVADLVRDKNELGKLVLGMRQLYKDLPLISALQGF